MDIGDEETIMPIYSGDSFKLVRDRNDPATFLPIIQSLCGNKSLTPRNIDCLTPRQTNLIYKQVELGNLINKTQ